MLHQLTKHGGLALVILAGAVPVTLCRGAYIIDGDSCGPIMPHMKEAVKTAQAWAHHAAKELGKKKGKRDPRIMRSIKHLLADDERVFGEVHKRFENISAFEFKGYADSKGALKPEDVVIVCNGDFIKKRKLEEEKKEFLGEELKKTAKEAEEKLIRELEKDIEELPYRDTIRMLRLASNGSMVEMKLNKPSSKAGAITGGGWETEWSGETKQWPGVMYFDQEWLKDLKEIRFPTVGHELTKRGLKEKDDDNRNRDLKDEGHMAGKELDWPDTIQIAEVRNVLLAATVLHEFQHLELGGGAEDIPEGEEYQWTDCVKHKEKDNAETVMLVAFVIELIHNHGVDVREDGRLYRPKQSRKFRF